MIKSLFNLPRPTVPIYVRSSAAAAAVESNDKSMQSIDDGNTNRVWVKSELEFPIRRIYCVGRNYREHAIEMGGNPDREPPFFFQKPSDAIVVCNPTATPTPTTTTCIPYPPMTSSLHYEGELIVAIGKDGLRINAENAMDHVYGYAVGSDLTRRDLQSESKKMGRPWDAAKGFDHSCPMSPIIPKENINLDANVSIQLAVNNSIRQQSAIGNMIYSVPEIISNLSQLFRLCQGDLILTGTPAGVSHLNVGDGVSITCGDLIPCKFVIGEPE
mmetsp:Transcript_24186/g.52157  ORF Transcript_24186/g.52157 Transcript_24186/m.52157 type:complete len:272 (+) Transcript_24186:73-888(+)|eukprot:CAMPEP_0172317566 /NCGR_PEP_ID=MMETSP1058-20130122/32016_1 /TAXON_ID=83371 /ORGANISM="Detonula confervacea, Strain CCMP 353" /LENGTH=271 /DNA_ID=CAMNT_0013032157 /DNA_START=39 /DNA_END=854 /DNA_ORIENTATION=-